MKAASIFCSRFHVFLVLVAAAFWIASPSAGCAENDPIQDAQPIARSWLAQIDAGQYEESYNAGGSALHDKVPEDKWILLLRTVRTPYGAVTNRKETSQTYKPNGYEGTEGEFVIFTYNTSFQKTHPEQEVVVLKREDGKWIGVGYDIGPKDEQDSPAEAPASQ